MNYSSKSYFWCTIIIRWNIQRKVIIIITIAVPRIDHIKWRWWVIQPTRTIGYLLFVSVLSIPVCISMRTLSNGYINHNDKADAIDLPFQLSIDLTICQTTFWIPVSTAFAATRNFHKVDFSFILLRTFLIGRQE